jgi:hypothetical protein
VPILKNIWKSMGLSPLLWKINNVPNHQPNNDWHNEPVTLAGAFQSNWSPKSLESGHFMTLFTGRWPLICTSTYLLVILVALHPRPNSRANWWHGFLHKHVMLCIMSPQLDD